MLKLKLFNHLKEQASKSLLNYILCIVSWQPGVKYGFTSQLLLIGAGEVQFLLVINESFFGEYLL